MADPALTLRRAGVADAPRLALLGQATFLTAFSHDHPGDALVLHCLTQHSEGLYAAWAADPDYALWLIETPLGAPIGYAMMTPPALDIAVPPGGLELKRIYALSGWQGAGLGARLVDAVIAEARARGADRLYLCVYEVNHRARRFYERLGFVKIGTQRFMVGDTGFTDDIMVREI